MKRFQKAKRILASLLALSIFVTAFSCGGMLSAGAAEVTDAKATYLRAFKNEPYAKVSETFTLTVDDMRVDVASYFNYSGNNYRYSYAHLAYEGTATFTIKALGGAITNYNISPHSYGIEAVVEGDTITFAMEQKNSRYLIIDVTTGNVTNQLIIACDPKLDLEKPVVDGETVIDITKAPYNADNTGATLLTPKNPTATNPNVLQQAIDDLSAKGGGTLYFPAGEYQFTYLYAKDNVTIWLDEGAALHGTTQRTQYTFNDSGQNGRQGPRNIQLQNAKNFSILGYGVVDANQHKIAMPRGAAGAPVTDDPQPEGYYPDGWDDFRTGIVDANGAENIRFEGVTFKDATGWTFNITNSTNIDIYNVKMLNDYAIVHSDGYDLVTCQDVEIIDCLGICGDDVFCPKAANSNREMKDYLIKDGVAYARGGAGCKVGVQSNAKTSNIEFNNIDVVQGYRAFSISHDEGQGAWEDIRFIDIRCEKLWVENSSDSGQYRPAAFIIWTLSRGAAPVSNIEVTNCSVENTYGLKGIIKAESPAGIVSNVKFINLSLDGMTINRANAVDKLDISGTVVTDSIKFTNTEYNLPQTVRYEMEGAKFANGADDNAAAGASCGRLAGNLGGGGNGTAAIQFVAEKAGEYEMEISHCSDGARTLGVTVNNGTQRSVNCASTGSFTANPAAQKITVELVEGLNTITFGGVNGGWAPNLDKVEISALPIDEIATVQEVIDAIDGLPEAENVVASHKRKVDSTMEIYNNLSNTQMAMVSNSAKLAAAADALAALDVEVAEMNPIDPNPDEIVPIGPEGVTLPVDPITGPKEVFEAEDAKQNGAVEIVDTATGGKTVNSVGLSETGDLSSIEFTVTTDVPGERTMEIYYISYATRDVRVTVNDIDRRTITCAGNNTDWDTTVTSVAIKVDLQVGENKIVLDNPNGWAPNIDRIEVAIPQVETDPEAAAVIAMIDALGEITSTEQKADVEAARAAYEALSSSDKKWITAETLDKLAAAEQAIIELDKLLPGDVDASTVVDVADIMKIKDLIMSGKWDDTQLAAGDLSGNGALDVADIMGIKNIIMSN